LSIDHAIDSFPIQQGQPDLLKKYVKLFAPELEIVMVNPDSADATTVTPGDPPNVRLRRTEGRNYLFLGYKHEAEHRSNLPAVKLVARVDIEQVAAAYLASRRDFDALVLVDGSGATIAQRSWSGLEVTSVQKLRDRGQGIPSGSHPEATGVFDRLRGTTNLAVVTIGASDFMLYVQPVQLSMMHEAPQGANPGPEEWTLCGLVRLDKFRAASAKIPTTYWLCFGALLALVCFVIPLLKLRVLSPRERIRRVDGASVAAAVFMMMALATFTALDLYVFGAVVPRALDDQLQQVAASISRHVARETKAVDAQMTQFEDPALWRDRLNYGKETDGKEAFRSLDEIRAKLSADEGAKIELNPQGSKGRSQCLPAWSCREGVLRQLADIPYPFFKLMVWNDDAGWQRIKWSTAPFVTPFINVGAVKLPYFDALKLARRFSATDDTVPTSGVSVIPSPNTGEKLTIFWKALDPPAVGLNDPPKRDLIGRTMATAPVSLTSPVLPKGIQFAVVDPRGLVLFHLDPARSLAENFFRESEENPTLKSLVASRESGMLSGPYLGRAHRFYVTPLEVAPFGSQNSGQGSRAAARWSLIVFQDAAIPETVNLETINLAGSMFTVYALALAAAWALLTGLWPGRFAKWLWPDRAKGPQYRRAAAVSAASGLACVGALPFVAPAALLAVAIVLIAGALGAVALIVGAKGRSSGGTPTWLADFFLARASLLFVLAAVPAILCFHVAYAFEIDLLAKRGQLHLATELAAREDRIRAQAQKVTICTASDSGSQTCAKVGQIVEHRTKATLWDVHVPAVREAPGQAGDSAFASTPLRAFLKRAYRPYNDIAADHLIASDSRAVDGLERWRLSVDDAGEETFTKADTPTGWRMSPALVPRPHVNGIGWLAIALLAVAYALGRYLLKPLFVLELEAPACPIAATGSDEETNRLVIGPSGLRTTMQFQGHPRVRIFDVRSLSFADEPTGVALAASSPHVRISSAADCGDAAEEQDADWIRSFHLAASHPSTIVGVAHLEHRLDDQTFRDKMLGCLEFAVYRQHAAVWIASSRDPLEAQESGRPAADRSRWVRLLESFRRETIGLEIEGPRAVALEQSLMRRTGLSSTVRSLIVSECAVAPELLAMGERLADRLPMDGPVSRDAVLADIGGAAQHFYEALWAGCATDERVQLRQLAEEGLVNPNNSSAIARLLSAGLVRRDRTFSIMNETFRRFVLRAASPQVISSWEREGVRLPWGTIATTGLTVAFGLAGLLLLTQEQMVDAWIGYVPALAPAMPTVWKVLATVQKGGKLDGAG
jgi:hypothetical protein